MPEQFGERFHRSRLRLSAGGVFDFDAVSDDEKTAACISTSSGKTARGKHAVGKLMKLRSDILFLHLAEGLDKRLIVLTEPDMHEVCLKEKSGGRVPSDIEFVLAEIPEELRSKLVSARGKASREVTPE